MRVSVLAVTRSLSILSHGVALTHPLTPLHIVKQEIQATPRNTPTYLELEELRDDLVRVSGCSVTSV